MMTSKVGLNLVHRAFLAYSLLAIFGDLCLSVQANAQGPYQGQRFAETIDADTQVTVRTTEPINTRDR